MLFTSPWLSAQYHIKRNERRKVATSLKKFKIRQRQVKALIEAVEEEQRMMRENRLAAKELAKRKARQAAKEEDEKRKAV